MLVGYGAYGLDEPAKKETGLVAWWKEQDTGVKVILGVSAAAVAVGVFSAFASNKSASPAAGVKATPNKMRKSKLKAGRRKMQESHTLALMKKASVPVDERCTWDRGCDRRATILVERPGHWHDDFFCASHAPRSR